MTLPKHLAVIIDGNRRWAKAHNLPTVEGHRRGIENLKSLVPVFIDRGIPVVSIFTFSTENWQRTKEEVTDFMGLIKYAFSRYADWLHTQGVQIRISGRVADFSSDIQDVFKKAVARVPAHPKFIANFCLSYGGREEITQMVQSIANERNGVASPTNAIDEVTIEKYLYTAGLPDVDFLIRTGGEKRLSGFLPWQTVYAELYFTDTFWPDFGAEELDKTLEDFSQRKRNFGA